MAEVAYAKTANRSVVGMLNEFSFLADCWRPRFGESGGLVPKAGGNALWAAPQGADIPR
jgi:hypothetical protein